MIKEVQHTSDLSCTKYSFLWSQAYLLSTLFNLWGSINEHFVTFWFTAPLLVSPNFYTMLQLVTAVYYKVSLLWKISLLWYQCISILRSVDFHLIFPCYDGKNCSLSHNVITILTIAMCGTMCCSLQRGYRCPCSECKRWYFFNLLFQGLIVERSKLGSMYGEGCLKAIHVKWRSCNNL